MLRIGETTGQRKGTEGATQGTLSAARGPLAVCKGCPVRGIGGAFLSAVVSLLRPGITGKGDRGKPGQQRREHARGAFTTPSPSPVETTSPSSLQHGHDWQAPGVCVGWTGVCARCGKRQKGKGKGKRRMYPPWLLSVGSSIAPPPWAPGATCTMSV